MDYDLRRLNEKSFEQLVQALTIAEFGAQVQTFGRGPDAGREAAFVGVDYVDQYSGHPWTGYGILQAKYVDVSDSDTQIGFKLFMRAVVTELRVWATSELRRLKQPNFILFATNGRLSAAGELGGIDQFYKVVEDEVKNLKLPLSGWDVWDYGKICLLLDKHQSVRNAYLGVVLPGDLLAQMMAEHTDKLKNTSDSMYSNLMSLFNEEDVMKIGEIGSTDQSSLALSSIFFDVPCKSSEANEPKVVATLIDTFDRITRLSDPASFRARVVLVGGPGQGKTTVGRFLAQVYRYAVMDSISGRASMAAKATSERLAETFSRLETPAPVNRRWPFRVVLTEYADALKMGSDDLSLSKFILDDFNRFSETKITGSDLSTWMRAWPTVLILDGMDEVPLDLRADIVRQIERFSDSLSLADADLSILITTRPQGDRTDFSSASFDHVYLSPLDWKVASSYAKRLAELRFGVGGRALAALHSAIDDAGANQNTKRLMTSPLQVAIMTLLLERQSRLPRGRFELFDAYFSTIYQREEAKSGFAGQMLQEYRPVVEGIIERCAFVLQLRSETAKDESARLSDVELREIIQVVMGEAEVGRQNSTIADKLLAAVTDRLVILVAAHEGFWEFEVRSLQEYMVARAWTSGEMHRPDILRILEITASSTYWRNAWLFAAGRAFSSKLDLRETIVATVAALNHSDVLAPYSRPAAALASDLLIDHALDVHPKYRRSLIPLAIQLAYVSSGQKLEELASTLNDLALDTLDYQAIRDAVESVRARNGGDILDDFLDLLSRKTGKLRLLGVSRETAKALEGAKPSSSGGFRMAWAALSADVNTFSEDALAAFQLWEEFADFEDTNISGFTNGEVMVAQIESLALRLREPNIMTGLAELADRAVRTQGTAERMVWILHGAESSVIRAPLLQIVADKYLVVTP